MADKITSLRLVLAPCFFVVYLFPRFFPSFSGSVAWTVPVLWLVFVGSELTDFLDGLVARKRGEVGDFGKLYDPFADTLTQLTFFLCFVLDGILPAALFLLVLYREFSILFVRNLMLRKGIAQGARMGGKIKTVTYIGACGLALLASSIRRAVVPWTGRWGEMGAAAPYFVLVSRAALAVFALSTVLAIVSFFDYIKVYHTNGEVK